MRRCHGHDLPGGSHTCTDLCTYNACCIPPEPEPGDIYVGYDEQFDRWDWQVYVTEFCVTGPYPGTPDEKVLFEAYGEAPTRAEAQWQAQRTLARWQVLMEVYEDEMEAMYEAAAAADNLDFAETEA
jgi:hypothetical protein